MRIISKETDYYDCIQGAGSDQTNVFVRKQEVIKSDQVNFRATYPKLFALMERINDAFEDMPRLNSYRWESARDRHNYPINVTPQFLFFCGEMIPLFSFSSPHCGEDSLYEADTPTRFLDRFVDTPESYLEESSRFSKTTRNDKIKAFYRKAHEAVVGRSLDEVFIELKTPVFLLSTSKRGYGNYPSEGTLTIHPNLKDLGLIRHVDPMQAFQRIDMYLNNNMVNADDAMIRISDEDMKVAKGFGHKYSFKKEPGKKHKNRA